MKNIFIDAQIWLSLYDFSSDDLDQFGKLKDLIVHGDVKIILTEQVRDEVMRNRENKLKDVLTKTENIKFSTPVLYQGYKTEYESLRKSIVAADKTNRELRTKIRHDIEKQTLPQDKLIKEFFDISTVLQSSKEALDKAVIRCKIIGNPPRKDDKCGDAITWETLLEQYENKSDMFFISGDKDFRSVVDETRMNQFLVNEWEKIKESKIFFYSSLTAFFSKHLTDIKLETQKKKEDLIDELHRSGSFQETHDIIKRMNFYLSWSKEQVYRIAKAMRTNSQVAWILTDDDLIEFVEKYIEPCFYGDNEDVVWIREFWIKHRGWEFDFPF